MATQSELKLNDVIVSKIEGGHHLLIVTAGVPDSPKAGVAISGTRRTSLRPSNTWKHFDPHTASRLSTRAPSVMQMNTINRTVMGTLEDEMACAIRSTEAS